MNVHPHSVNRTPGSRHHVRLAVYHPLEATCPFTDVSVVVAVLSSAVLSSAVLLAAVLLAVVLTVDALGPLGPPGLFVPLAAFGAAGVTGPAGVVAAGLPDTSVASPTSTVSSAVAARNW